MAPVHHPIAGAGYKPSRSAPEWAAESRKPTSLPDVRNWNPCAARCSASSGDWAAKPGILPVLRQTWMTRSSSDFGTHVARAGRVAGLQPRAQPTKPVRGASEPDHASSAGQNQRSAGSRSSISSPSSSGSPMASSSGVRERPRRVSSVSVVGCGTMASGSAARARYHAGVGAIIDPVSSSGRPRRQEDREA